MISADFKNFYPDPGDRNVTDPYGMDPDPQNWHLYIIPVIAI